MAKSAVTLIDEIDVAIRYVLSAEPYDHAKGIAFDPTRCPWTGKPVPENPQGCAWCAARSILRKIESHQ